MGALPRICYPFAFDAQLQSDILAAACQWDVMNWLRDASIVEIDDTSKWHSMYDDDLDKIFLQRKFFQMSPQEQVRTLLHEAGHRGQAKVKEIYEEFKARHLNTVSSFVEMANQVHLEDFNRKGEVEGGIAAEVFAESYARFCLGMDMPEELRSFWTSQG